MQVAVEGADVYVEAWGSGPPLLMLHGHPDTSAMWRPLAERLSDSYRCLAPDLPGWGRTEVAETFDYGLEHQAQFLDGLVDQLGVSEPVTLLVHDIGGPFGLSWACRHADRVGRLIIFNTAFQSDYPWHFWARVWRTPVLGELSMAILNWPLFRQQILASSNLTEDLIRESYDAITPRCKRMVLRWYRAANAERYRGWEDELLTLTARIPTLVVWGDRDPYIDKGFAERFGTRKVVHLPKSGHWPFAEYPDEVAGLLRQA